MTVPCRGVEVGALWAASRLLVEQSERWERVVSEGASKATSWSHLVTLGVWAHFPLRKPLSLGNSL